MSPDSSQSSATSASRQPAAGPLNVLPTEHHCTILIVDDMAEIRKLLADLLRNQNYTIIFAASGAEALTMAETHLPDLVLLDVMLPGIDGFTICQRLRANERLAYTPIIMVTALDDRDSRLRGIEAGADDFITKPFDRIELRTRVKMLTQLNRYRRLLEEQAKAAAERARFAWVVAQSEDGYLVLDQQGALLYANQQARCYLDLPPGEDEAIIGVFPALATNHYSLVPPDSWAAWPTLPTHTDCYLMRPETATDPAVWLQVDTLQLATEPSTEIVVRIRDVTTRIAAQQVSWTFHSMVSHKLRTPLAVLLGSLNILASRAVTITDPAVGEIAGMALSGGRRLHGAIDHILSYIDAPRYLVAAQGCALSRVREIVAGLSADLDLASVTLTVADDLDALTLGLAPQNVELVLQELLENARKFHPRQSPVIEIVIERLNEQQVRIQVYDDGLTLSPAQINRVWALYYQNEPTFTGRTDGVGLGLPVVARIIWGVGGSCRLANRTDGPGIVVELVIPVVTS